MKQMAQIAAAVVAIVASGCGSDSGPPTKAPTKRRCVEACKALTDPEVTSLLGGVDKPGGQAGLCVVGADATTSPCKWAFNNATLSLEVGSESQATFETIRSSQKLGPGYVDIPGVGDIAFKGTLGVSKWQAEIFFRVTAVELTFQLIYGDPSVGSPTGGTPADIDQRLKTAAIAIAGRASSL